MPAAPRRHSLPPGQTRPAFTLIELLVVIAIIGILIAAVTIAGRGLSDSNKRRVTENTMRLTMLAIEHFAQTDPLKQVYNSRSSRAFFGPHPPYQLAYPTGPDLTRPPYDVARLIDNLDGVPGGVVGTLAERMMRDLVGRPGETAAAALSRISMDLDGPLDQRSDQTTLLNDARNNRHHNDIRSLYVYLRLLAPGVLDQLPPQVFRSLSRSSSVREFINTSASGAEQSRTEILGIVDAWGMPLDYYLNVKIEFAGRPNGLPTYRITDRAPTLRSRGITPEEDRDERADPLYATDRAPSDPGRWLFSSSFPSPRANSLDADAYGPTGAYSSAGYAFRWTGVLSIDGPEVNGWARALGVGDVAGNLAYVP